MIILSILLGLFTPLLSYGQLDPSVINANDFDYCSDCFDSPIKTPRSFSKGFQTNCIKELNCEERIFMSHLSSLLEKEKDPKEILALIDQELSMAQKKYGLNVRPAKIKSSLIAYLKKLEALQKTPEQREAEKIALNRMTKIAPFMDAYMDSLDDLGQYLNKLNQQPWFTTWSMYAVTDTESPLEWIMNRFGLDTLEWKDTPLATALEGVKHFRRLLIQEYEEVLIQEGLTQPEIRQALSKMSKEVWNEHDKMIMQGIESADTKVFQGLNTTKKIYGATLGAMMIPGGMAIKGESVALMLLALSVNGAGWSLAANSFKEFIDAGIESSGNEDISYWCAYARQGVEDYGLSALWSEVSLGLALGIVGGGLAKGALNASTPLAKGAFTIVGGTAALGGVGLMGKTYLTDLNDLHQLENDYHWNEQAKICLKKAKVKIGSGIAVDLSTLYLGLKGIGEPKISTPSRPSPKKVSTKKPTPELENGAFKASSYGEKVILDLSDKAKTAKSKMPEAIQKTIDEQRNFFEKYGIQESPYLTLRRGRSPDIYIDPKSKHVADFIAKNFSNENFMVDSLTILKGDLDTFLAGRPYSNSLFDEFIEIQAKGLGLEVKTIPEACCKDFAEFSQYIGGVIIDVGVEANPHGRYGHALQALTIAKHVDKFYGAGTYKRFLSELPNNNNAWRDLYDINLKEHKNLKSGLKIKGPDGQATRADVMFNFSQPEFISMLARRIGLMDDLGGKYIDVIRAQ